MEDDTCVQSDDEMYLIAETEIREFMLALESTALRPIYYLLCLALEALIASEDDRLSEYGHHLLEGLKTAHEFTAYRQFVTTIAGAAAQGSDRLQTAIRTVSYAVQLVAVIPSDQETEALIGEVRFRASERMALARVVERRNSAESLPAPRAKH